MDPQIHGAIVGGAIGAGTVLVGVFSAEVLQSAREARAEIGDAVRRLNVLVPHVVVGLSDIHDPPLDRGPESLWYEQFQEVMTLTTAIARLARRPVRRWKRIQMEARDVMARIAGADLAADYDARLLAAREVVNIRMNRLNRAVFGDDFENLDDTTRRYREEGPPPY